MHNVFFFSIFANCLNSERGRPLLVPHSCFVTSVGLTINFLSGGPFVHHISKKNKLRISVQFLLKYPNQIASKMYNKYTAINLFREQSKSGFPQTLRD